MSVITIQIPDYLRRHVERLAAADGISVDQSFATAAGVHRMNFLLTWNCKHIANPFNADRLHTCFSDAGFHLPVICTPEQFFTDDNNDSEDRNPEGA